MAGPHLKRVEPGAYETLDGLIRVANMNDGKRDAVWVAVRGSDAVARGSSLREVRAKLGKLDAVAASERPGNVVPGRDEISNLCARFAAAADVGDPWDSGRLGREIRRMLEKHGWRRI